MKVGPLTEEQIADLIFQLRDHLVGPENHGIVFEDALRGTLWKGPAVK